MTKANSRQPKGKGQTLEDLGQKWGPEGKKTPKKGAPAQSIPGGLSEAVQDEPEPRRDSDVDQPLTGNDQSKEARQDKSSREDVDRQEPGQDRAHGAKDRPVSRQKRLESSLDRYPEGEEDRLNKQPSSSVEDESLEYETDHTGEDGSLDDNDQIVKEEEVDQGFPDSLDPPSTDDEWKQVGRKGRS